MKRIFLAIILSFFSAGAAHHPKADTVLRHGKIYTMDAARSWAESVAIKDGRIVYVGDDAGLTPWIGDKTKTIELSGRFVLPGFIDSHAHPVEAGVGLKQCDLLPYNTKEEVLKAVRDYVASHPKDPWILGSGWQLPVFPDANPQKEWLDEIVSDRPVFLYAMDGHSAWANSKALEMAGVTKDTPDPEAGRIERNQKGEPSGALRESAADLVSKVAPKTGIEEKIEGLRAAVKILNQFGITGFQDASVSVEERGGTHVYSEVDRQGLLTVRVIGAMYADPSGSLEDVLKQVERYKTLRAQYKNGKHFHATAVKIFSDGVIESRTAALLEPYLNQGKNAGELNWPPEKLNPFVELLDREKFQIHIHAIGDRGIRVALDAIEAAEKKNGLRDRRPLMAHIELIDPQDIPRFAKLSVIPNFQPLWAYEDEYIKDLTVPQLGKERSRWLYPINSVASKGARLAMGSDWPVSSANPLDGIEVAVRRTDFDESEENPFIPEERITLESALAAYTIGSAYANFRDKEVGSIENGKLADLIVLSQNLFDIPPHQINETKVVLTLFEGKEVYRAM
ncbi:amidohydrolase [bacterium]|nr:amidohydrolase [bacterium]